MARPIRKRKPQLKSVESVTVVHIKPHGAEEEEDVVREVHTFITDPAFVQASAGMTKSLGNYESLRVGVSITMPCYAEMVEETHGAIAATVADLLGEEIDYYLEEEGKK